MSLLGVLAAAVPRLSHLMHRLEARRPSSSCARPGRMDGTPWPFSPGGTQLAVVAAPIHVEHVRRLIFDVLDDAEQHALRRALTKILSKLMEGL